MLPWSSPIALVNGRIITPEGEARTLRFRRRIIAIDSRPLPGDTVIDLDGRFVLPGLINAHDHLELNHYGPLKRRAVYANARDWIDDLRPVIRESSEIRAKSRIALADRLFIGGLKNLLAGVTTVAHHNPLYCQFGLRFPVRLLRRFGWAHSLGLEQGPAGANGEPGGVVAERCATTPQDTPFIVHAAEGVDAVAAGEVDTLDAENCLQPNTVLVHGLAIPEDRWAELFARGVSLVWCPASNRFLFDRTLRMPRLLQSADARSRVCLGTDSRVTGSNDLLDELRTASECGVGPQELLRMVTTAAADTLRLVDAGRIRVGATADLTVIPAHGTSAGEALLGCQRSDIALVLQRGTPVLGDRVMAATFSAGGVHVARIEVDGREKLAQTALARRIARCAIAEPGVRAV